MSYIDLTITSNPSTPATNHAELFVSSSNKHLRTIDDTGTVLDFGGGTVGTGTSGQNAVYNGTTSITSGATMSMNSTKITSLANGTASTDAMAFGQNHYLQTPVQATTSSSTTINSAVSYVNTALTATITPTTVSSKIKITVAAFFSLAATSGSNATTYSIKRGSTEVTGGSGLLSVGTQPAGVTIYSGMSLVYIDSPATTSSTTYTVAGILASSGQTSIFNPGSGPVYIVLEEVI